MKKSLLSIPILITGLFAMTTGAWAEANVVANINHDFVAGGKTHSAGTYTVYRVSPEAMILRSEETGASTFLLPSMHEEALPGHEIKVKLIEAGGVYYLSEIATDVKVYTLPAPQSLKGSRPDAIVESPSVKQ
jgi:hypothetical protein